MNAGTAVRSLAGRIVPLLVALLAGLLPGVPAAAEALPVYELRFLGPGTPTAIGGEGVVVGARVVGSAYEPLVSIGGAPWSALPVPGGAASAFPTDVNDHGVIVGVSYTAQWVASAVRWAPAGGGYAVEVLPRLPGDASSYATGINNLGQVVGARGALGYVPQGAGWLYGDDIGLVDLQAAYGWWGAPTAINDAGQIIGGTMLLDLRTGVPAEVAGQPANYQPVACVAINDAGALAGDAALRSSSLNVRGVFRHDGVAWRYLAGSSKYAYATSINNLGDVGYGEQGAGLYLEGLGLFALGSLVDPAHAAAGWAVTGGGVEINDRREVATVARNSVTGETGGVLLVPAGTLSPPDAPANLTATAHAATRMEPFNAILLAWENTSALARGYELARRAAGESGWTPIPLVAPGTGTSHADTTVGVGVAYEYRVRAVGLGGASPWSNVASATSPATPLDTTPPEVSILAPADGATVSGTVAVSAQAVDDVGVAGIEVGYWDQYLGRQVLLGAGSAGSVAASWDTSGLAPADYTVTALAWDALGNWRETAVVVTVAPAAKVMRVAGITLGGTLKGKTATITGVVRVLDAAGRAVPSARVAVAWALPGGGSRTASALTGGDGRARFQVAGPRGRYTLTVAGVTRDGYRLDAAGSVLSKSIVK